MNTEAASNQRPGSSTDLSGYLYITGGRQRSYVETEEWRQYGKGVIVRVDTATGAGEACVEYESPPDVCPDEESSITFKSASVVDDRLYVCTSTEVLVYVLPQCDLVEYVSIPCFNDLHHVHPTPRGTMVVVNTGLDMVVEVTPSGEVLREWDVLGRDTWQYFSPQVDYRKVRTTKPHKSHPNHVFGLGDQIWVTRFQQRDAVLLNGNGNGDGHIPIGIHGPHDGTPYRGYVYFTTVDGHIVVVNEKTRKTEDIIDLNAADGEPLGWCRGLKLIEPTKAWVGFSRFRPTKFLENVNWIKNGFRRPKPTHLALYDLVTRSRIREIGLEPLGLHTVFSMVSGPGPLDGPASGVTA